MTKATLPGLFVALALGISLHAAKHLLPIDPILLALLIGAIWGQTPYISRVQKGFQFTEKHILATAIALMGLTLPGGMLKELGWQWIALGVPLLLYLVFVPRFFSPGEKRDAALLLGIGTGICGSAAIASATRVKSFSSNSSALALTSINLWGSLGLLAIPALLYFLPFNSQQLGWLTGGTLQSVGHAVAAGNALGTEAGEWAVWYKMQRVLWLVPVLLILSFGSAEPEKRNVKNLLFALPRFLWVFLALLALNATNWVPMDLVEKLKPIPGIFINAAMVGIGSKLTWTGIKSGGVHAFWLGGSFMLIQLTLLFLLAQALA